jgi:hypothetical protein
MSWGTRTAAPPSSWRWTPPGVAHSLALLEPGLMVGASAQGYRDSLARAVERYREVGAAVVMDEFLQAWWPSTVTSIVFSR